jgi:hypothetical protein
MPNTVISQTARPETVAIIRCNFCQETIIKDDGAHTFAGACRCVVCSNCYFSQAGLCRLCPKHNLSVLSDHVFESTDPRSVDEVNIATKVDYSVIFAAEMYDVDTDSNEQQERLVDRFRLMMKKCTQYPKMTLAEAHFAVFQDSVVERIQNKMPETEFIKIGIDIMRQLEIPYELWRVCEYKPDALLRIGYEQHDFDMWDAKQKFTRQDAEELRAAGIEVA